MHTIILDKVQKSAKCKIRVVCLLEYRYRVIMCENCVYFLFSTVSISHFRSTDLSQCVLLDWVVPVSPRICGRIKWFLLECGLFVVFIVGSFFIVSLFWYTFSVFFSILVTRKKNLPVWCKLCGFFLLT